MENLELNGNVYESNENRSMTASLGFTDEASLDVFLEKTIDSEVVESVSSPDLLNQTPKEVLIKHVKARDFIETLFQIIIENNTLSKGGVDNEY